MKKLALFLAFIGLLIGGGIYAVKTIDPVAKVKAVASEAVKAQTGRDLTFTDARLMVWPHIGVRLKNVTISNVSWSQQKEMMTIGAVEVRLVTQALLEKRFEVAQFVLQQPEIILEKSARGEVNWAFKPEKKPEAVVQTEAKSAGSATDLAKTYGFKLGEFLINKGKVTYIDHALKTEEKISDINVAVTMPNLDSAAQLDGSLTFRDKKLQIVLFADKPSALIQGQTTPGGISVKSPDLTFDFKGDLATAGVLARGKVQADIPNMTALTAWLAQAEPANAPFNTLSFTADTQISADKIVLQNAELALDGDAVKGDVTLSLSGKKPVLNGQLTMDKLVLDRFMPVTEASAPQGKTTAQGAGWNEIPMDFSGLHKINLDLTLKTNGFSLRGIEVGASTLNIDLKDGMLKATSSPATLLEGQFNAAFSANAASVPQIWLLFSMQDVQSQPILATFADFKKLSGKVDANIDVSAFGKSQRQIISSLTGKGAAKFKNGAFEGIDLVNIAKLLQSNLTNIGVGEGKTEFVDLGGTFTVAKGIVSNKDLKMRGPLVQASGAGDIDLPQKMLNYRVTPVLTASSAVDGAKGIGIPVDIKGPFAHIKVKPDYKSVITKAIEDPSAIKETVKNAEQQIKQLKKDPKSALKNLLGGGGLFGEQPAAEEAVTPDAPAAVSDPVPPSESDMEPVAQ